MGIESKHFPWLEHLDEEDRREFFWEIRDTLAKVDALGMPGVERTSDEYLAPLETVLTAWQHTAEVMSDPEVREILLNGSLEDFGPVLPPDACWDPRMCTLENPCPRCEAKDKEARP